MLPPKSSRAMPPATPPRDEPLTIPAPVGAVGVLGDRNSSGLPLPMALADPTSVMFFADRLTPTVGVSLLSVMLPVPPRVTVSVPASAFSRPSTALPVELTVTAIAAVVLLVVVIGAVAACVKPPDPAVMAILPVAVSPVLLPRLMVVAARVTAPPTVIGAVANWTLPVVRLRFPLMPVPLIPFSVVVPVPADCVRLPAMRTVFWNVTAAADTMVTPVSAVVAPVAPSVRLPAASVAVRALAPSIEVALRDPPAVLKDVFPASVIAPSATLSAEVLKAAARVVAEAVEVKPPSKVKVSPPSPRMTPPVLTKPTELVMVLLVPVMETR